MSTFQGIVMLATYHGFINFGLATGLIAGVACLIGAVIMMVTGRPGEKPRKGRGRGRGGVAYGNA